MDYILRFVPHPQKEDFDIIYLYFMALEMIDSQFWNIINPIMADRTERFDNIVSYLAAKYSNWNKKIGRHVPQEMKDQKISPSTCLACNAVSAFLYQLIRQKRQLVQQAYADMRGTLLIGNEGDSLGMEVVGNNPRYTELMRLKEKKEFRDDYVLFFQHIDIVLQPQIDHEQFRDACMQLFPLCPYLGRV